MASVTTQPILLKAHPLPPQNLSIQPLSVSPLLISLLSQIEFVSQ